MKRFVHRAHLYSSCTNRSSTHCTLLWRAINSRLTLGDRWARHPCYFLQDFHDRLPAACTEHMYPLTVFCLSLLGIRESTGVNRFHTTVHLWDSVCIHTFTWVYSFNEYTVQLFGQNRFEQTASSFAYGLYRGEGIHFADDFPLQARYDSSRFPRLIDVIDCRFWKHVSSLIDKRVLSFYPSIHLKFKFHSLVTER